MKSQVLISFDVEGFHLYPNAPKQVDFLSYKHRHTFKVTCSYLVSDLNREKEIFIQRDEIKFYLQESYGSPCDFENMSCEMIAKEIIDFAKEDGMIWCEVWEEQTGGARIEI